jgi:hypothetical protein
MDMVKICEVRTLGTTQFVCRYKTSVLYSENLTKEKGRKMSEINRICPQCGGKVSLQTRYCGECGHDTSTGLPVQRTNLPVQIGKAALPVVVGLAGLALRSGWKLLQTQLAQASQPTLPAQQPPMRQQPMERTPTQPARRGQRIIRIRSSWVIGDARGDWKQGNEEHIIEIDE